MVDTIHAVYGLDAEPSSFPTVSAFVLRARSGRHVSKEPAVRRFPL